MAVVGMAGRFPGAAGVDELWTMLLARTEAVRRFSPAELRAAGVAEETIADPRYLPYAADLAGIEDFDAAFFGITPAEARLIDPQHRIFLECVWSALEDAAAPPSAHGGRVGVFGSTSLSSYLLHHVLRSPEFRDQAFTYPVLLGNDKDFLATRVSYALNLRGPSVSVQSACSSSLVAVDEACAALRSARCDIAVAGGVSVFTPQTVGYRHQEGGTYARDGHCRPFDAAASGMVRGSGCGVVVLKRLEDALADADHIYALIAGTAVNNDGSAKAAYSAPSPLGQDEVVTACLDASGVPASSIGYVEAHGTGTYLGDPIEVAALRGAYERTGDPPSRCALGSLKANIGHLDAAAGVTGLIKAALVLHHQTIPPQANFTEPNPELRLDDGPFDVPTHPVSAADPLRAAAVTSLGIGGTNAHAVLTRAPAPPARTGRAPEGTGCALRLSAPDGERLRELADDLLGHLERHPHTRLDDLAHTLSGGRTVMARQAEVRAATLQQALAGLRRVREGHTEEPAAYEKPGGSAGAEPSGGVRGARKIRLPGIRLRRVRHWIELEPPGTSEPPGTPEPSEARASRVSGAVRSGGGTPEAVAEVFRERLGAESVEVDDDYFALGGDSLLAVDLVETLSRVLQVPLSAGRFAALRTPRRVAEWSEGLRGDGGPGPTAGPDRADGTDGADDTDGTGRAGGAEGAESTDDGDGDGDGADPDQGALTLVKEGRPDDAAVPVFLVHPSGGTVSFAYALAAHSRDPSPLYAIGYPAALSGSLTTIPGMARYYLRLIREARPNGPYRVGGYSLGGTVALEIARLLREAGERVERVLLFDTMPPREGRRALSEEEFLDLFPGLLRLTLGLPEPEAPHTGTASAAAAAAARNGAAGPAARHEEGQGARHGAGIRTVDEAIASVRPPGYGEATSRELRTLYEVWRVCDRALARHTPGVYAGPVELFAAKAPLPRRPGAALASSGRAGEWRGYLTGELRVTPVPGHHFSLFGAAQLPALAAAYDSALARTPGGAPTGSQTPGDPDRRTPDAPPRPDLPAPAARAAGPRAAIALLFPGQGTQHTGMGRELLSRYPELLAEADDVLGYSIAGVCAGDPRRPLTDTAYAQPAVYVVSALALRAHLEEGGEAPSVALGHSVGEYNALEAAGVLSFGDGLRVLVRRAAAMARVAGGGMAAVSGLTEEDVQEILNGAGPGPRPASAFASVDIAAFNAPRHLTLAGPATALESLTPVLLAHGARSVRGLNVSGPFHSRLMRPAAEEFRAALAELEPPLASPAFPVIANTTGRPHRLEAIPDELAAQIDHPVQWQRSVERAIADHEAQGGGDGDGGGDGGDEGDVGVALGDGDRDDRDRRPGRGGRAGAAPALEFRELGGRRVLTPMVAQVRAALSGR
jgi:malonyl CoA-acyl carrier protein transacylase